MRELAITDSSARPQIGLALTPEAFKQARRANVSDIRADLVAMEAIAAVIGRPLKPMVLVACAPHPPAPPRGQRAERLPAHGTTYNYQYYPASELGQKQPQAWAHQQLARYAGAIGAHCLTEIVIPGWEPGDLHSHAAALASSLIGGQRPLYPVPPLRPAFYLQLLSYAAHSLNTGIPDIYTNWLAEHKRLQPPFTIEYESVTYEE